MLDDVLREMREVGQVELLPPYQRLAFPQPVRHRPRSQRDREENDAEHAGGGVVSGRCGLAHPDKDLLCERSEERRVGKECRSRWSPDHLKKKKKKDECVV